MVDFQLFTKIYDKYIKKTPGWVFF